MFFLPPFAALLSSCGQMLSGTLPPKVPSASVPGVGYSGSLVSNETIQGNFVCPIEPNVVPDYDWEIDGSTQYQVCLSQSSTYSILVHGRPSTKEKSKKICVFPIEYRDQDHVFIKPDLTRDPEGKIPLSICQKSESQDKEGTVFLFNSTNFNTVMIIDFRNKEKMEFCLNPKQTNFYNCPPFSYGKFR